VSSLKTPTASPSVAGTPQRPRPTNGTRSPDATTSPLPRQSWLDNGTQNYQQTVSTDGGWATIRWNSANVTIIDYLAEAGYSADVQRTSATNVEVRFRSSGKSTSITAWWNHRTPGLDVDNAAS
jgi:hypothetical protein